MTLAWPKARGFDRLCCPQTEVRDRLHGERITRLLMRLNREQGSLAFEAAQYILDLEDMILDGNRALAFIKSNFDNQLNKVEPK